MCLKGEASLGPRAILSKCNLSSNTRTSKGLAKGVQIPSPNSPCMTFPSDHKVEFPVLGLETGGRQDHSRSEACGQRGTSRHALWHGRWVGCSNCDGCRSVWGFFLRLCQWPLLSPASSQNPYIIH